MAFISVICTHEHTHPTSLGSVGVREKEDTFNPPMESTTG